MIRLPYFLEITEEKLQPGTGSRLNRDAVTKYSQQLLDDPFLCLRQVYRNKCWKIFYVIVESIVEQGT